MDAHQWNGDYDRDHGSGEDGNTVERAFWRAFEYSQRHGCLDAFYAIYEPVQTPQFLHLVAEAKRRAAQMPRRGAA